MKYFANTSKMNQSQTGGEGERRIKNFANMSKMDQGDRAWLRGGGVSERKMKNFANMPNICIIFEGTNFCRINQNSRNLIFIKIDSLTVYVQMDQSNRVSERGGGESGTNEKFCQYVQYFQ